MNWLESVDIFFECKDLISIDVEAIVCSVTVNLDAYGQISQQLFKTGQSHLKHDLIAIQERLANQKLTLGQAISLDCKHTYNIPNIKKLIFVAMWDSHSEYTFNLFYKAYINALREALQHQIKSIALPVMAYDGNLIMCGQAIVKVIHDLDCLKNSSEFSIEEVIFTTTNCNHIEFLKKEVEPILYL